jgi:hypothetical protein
MKRLLSCLFVGLVISFTAAPAHAASTADTNRILRLQNRLVHLPDGGAPQAQVSQLLYQLARLQPRFASRYFTIASKKLSAANYNRALNRLANRTIHIVKGSNISTNGILKISLQIEVTVERKAEPTPTPYQALLAPETRVVAEG